MLALASRGRRLTLEAAEWLRRDLDLTLRAGRRWIPNYCVMNYYVDENDFLGAHSDPVNGIGPWATVAFVTLGAARQFRMSPVGTILASQGGRITSFSIRLPHNSLLICWGGFQEFWRHAVPKDKGLARHVISGSGRLNFTFRQSAANVSARAPVCFCGKRANMKPVLKQTSSNLGRYFWSCTNPRVRKGTYQSCEFFQWDDELL